MNVALDFINFMMTCTKIKESCDVCKMANDTAESFENCDTRFKKFAKVSFLEIVDLVLNIFLDL